ncbi:MULTISPECIES: hypothetical protein [Pseudoalteromonas]|uniref:hypothetical protein n=1 Tax=Pseudoalteromonas TaxID=53246 RepID=UPI0015833738|nr:MULTISPECIES: hypothetical protein [Pseudoalteromonas]MDI4654243.1 hypothetical protein [Pseudoalteromonas shioyasakiensis]NUJ40197.1 hypothetical protein [Pseudoalteromonas sp. 0303]
MAKGKVLPNQSFNDWTVIESKGKDTANKELFKCKCICGTIKIIRKCSLGRVKGCGCSRKKNVRRYKENIDKSFTNKNTNRNITLDIYKRPHERSKKPKIDELLLKLKEKRELLEVWEERWE